MNDATNEVVDAWVDINRCLDTDEVVEAIVFGEWGGYGFGAPETLNAPPVGKVLTLEEARPFLKGWSFNGGYGTATCFAAYIYTDKQIISVSEYDGSTGLYSVPRNPVAGKQPHMSGG